MKVRWVLLGLVVLVLLVPAVMVTAVRLLEMQGGRSIRLVSFTPHVTLLYALALLLLLLAVVAGRGAWRWVAVVAGLPVLAVLALHTYWASDMFVGADPSAGGETLTVMTANLSLGDADPKSVVDLARENRADVVVLLEITEEARAGLRRAGLDQTFRHVAGEIAYAVKGTMVFSSYPLDEVVSLDTAFRGYTMRVRAQGGPFDLVAVHPPQPMSNAAQWRADHETIRQAAVALRGPTIIAGDLNATLDHLPMRELDGRGFLDAAEQADAGWQPTWPSSERVSLLGLQVPTLLQIDHVLIDDGFRSIGTETMSVPRSDHRAVIATLERR